jgi:hypothetical protein
MQTRIMSKCSWCKKKNWTAWLLGAIWFGTEKRKRKQLDHHEGAEEDITKPYECRFCPMKFAKSQALGGHMNRHRQGDAHCTRPSHNLISGSCLVVVCVFCFLTGRKFFRHDLVHNKLVLLESFEPFVTQGFVEWRIYSFMIFDGA